MFPDMIYGIHHPGICRVCGCTESNACFNPEQGNCWWVDEDRTLCSHCAYPEIADDPATVHCAYSQPEKPQPEQ